MKILKKIIVFSSILIIILLIGAKYYNIHKEIEEQKIENKLYRASEEQELYAYQDEYKIFLNTDPGFNSIYYLDIGIATNFLVNEVIAKMESIEIEIYVYDYDYIEDISHEIYYDLVLIDVLNLDLNINSNLYLDVVFNSTDWDTNSIRYDLDYGDGILNFYPPQENSEVNVSVPLNGYSTELYLTNDVVNELISWNYTEGYNDGFSDGEQQGETNGYFTGYNLGYNKGYVKGVSDGEKTFDFSFISDMFDQTNDFMNLEIFPGLKLWYLIGGPLIISLIIAVLKLMR